jgi:hypothetical protein
MNKLTTLTVILSSTLIGNAFSIGSASAGMRDIVPALENSAKIISGIAIAPDKPAAKPMSAMGKVRNPSGIKLATKQPKADQALQKAVRAPAQFKMKQAPCVPQPDVFGCNPRINQNDGMVP